MFLKKLIMKKTNGDIYNIVPLEIIREVEFKQGLNIITDDGNKNGNTVGKSTFLYLIDLCFGARDIEKIYKNKYNKSYDNVIKNFIDDNKVIVSLDMKDHQIIRPLYIKDTIILDGEVLGLQEFNLKMSKILFNFDNAQPSFRNLMSKFIRLEDYQVKNMLDFNHTNVKNIQKQLIRRFLFGYPDIHTASIRTKISIELESFKDKNKAFAGFKRNQIEQEIGVLKKQIASLEEQKNSIRLIHHIDKDIIENAQIMSKYRFVKNELVNKDYMINSIRDNMKILSGRVRDINMDLLSSLYNEAVSITSGIDKTFEDLVNFHNIGISHELTYMENTLLELIKEKENLEQELLILSKQYISQKLFDNLDNIISELSLLNIELGKREKELEQLNSYEETIIRYNTELSKYQTDGSCADTFRKNIEKFNIIFADIYKKMFNKNPSVLYEEESGLLKINTDRERNGSGEDVGEVVAFDLAYLQYIQELGLGFPLFQIQDQLEMTDIKAKEMAFNKILPGLNCQYIAAILYSSTDKLFDKDIILQLSQNDKLFKA